MMKLDSILFFAVNISNKKVPTGQSLLDVCLKMWTVQGDDCICKEMVKGNNSCADVLLLPGMNVMGSPGMCGHTKYKQFR